MKHDIAAKALLILGCGYFIVQANADDTLPNACPIDGCIVKIVDVSTEGTELKLRFESNFKPDNARNHFHMWWGDLYDVKQVSRDAMSTHGVEQGKWHRHDDFPEYITTKSASTELRDGSTTMCVTAADRDHVVLDTEIFNCVDVSKELGE